MERLPDQHITEYARQLDRRQRDCIRMKTTISESDKVDLFVKNMYTSRLYEEKFLVEWEALVD